MMWELDSHTTIEFPKDLTEEAFEQLANIPLETLSGNYWMWDPDQGRMENIQSMESPVSDELVLLPNMNFLNPIPPTNPLASIGLAMCLPIGKCDLAVASIC